MVEQRQCGVTGFECVHVRAVGREHGSRCVRISAGWRSERVHVLFGPEFWCSTGKDFWVGASSASFKCTTRGARFEFSSVLGIIVIKARRRSDWAHVVFGHVFDLSTHWDF